MARVAIYPGSFDPITLGHLDIIQRAAKLVDKLVVGIGYSPEKSNLFTPDERCTMISELTHEIENIEVKPFTGLTVAFADSVGATYIIRGLRTGGDFDYESQMAVMNSQLAPHLETLLFPTNPKLRHISSSLAKDIARHGGDTSGILPPLVGRKTSEKIQ